MNRSLLRSLFTFFLLIILLGIMVCCQLAIRTGFASLYNSYGLDLGDSPLDHDDVKLLRLAAEKLGKEEERAEVERLLHRINPSAGRNGRQRSFLSSDKDSQSNNVPMMMMPMPQFDDRLWREFQVHLNDWWRRKNRFEPDILSDLVHLVRKDVPIRYSSCAVVGNSGILLNTEHGPLIDSHEAVIRLNNARIVGFERNVGFKTNISFVNSNILHLCARREWCHCNPYGENVPISIITYICQPIHLMDYTICNRDLLMVTDPRFDELCARIVKYYSLKRFFVVEKTNSKKAVEEWGAAHEGSMFHYSSGLQAVMLAVGICEKVSIFGFGKSSSSKHHYHTNQVSELHLHDYEAEYSIYQDLVQNPHLIPFISHNNKFKFPPLVIYK